ncbi:pyrethroid hydrolase Ces2a [Tribolium castaneum]|uniref:Esterase-6-like Protein n=1 Tax=Tribolium castaneum TaxID=7070 RepID=D6W6X8_TRICA|nr:PREDICTED: pyrethroid hydrolase Ces2e [Tribolium castaneum]EFA11441.1 Esterase-6-like Protein [Tribolium castaneum]|eukprot:XP_968892.1 PREDICTED: pyrethroid hydrolase Ces2e [Tribolium castaneum]
MTRFCSFCLFTFWTCFAAREPPTVDIPGQGRIMGKEISRYRSQKIIGYYGIPYAQPPIDDLRFAPPDTSNLVSWEGVRNLTDYMPACLQTESDIREESKPFLQLIYPSYSNLTTDEDCLYLNVFVPFGKPPASGFATIMWFHPGNYTTGSPSMWNPHTLVYRYRVILVTFAWRLGIMGFFTTMDGEAPGNFGLMDQQAAMMWVKKNIKLFGGNEDNISLMGYGTGGVSVGIHMVNTQSREYFHKAIVMSANFLNPSVIKYPQEDKSLLDHLAKFSGCIRKPTSRLIECLRQLDGKPLVEQTSNINWRPLLDAGLSNTTTFLPELPRNYFERGEFHKVPFLTGYTNNEDILAVTTIIDEFETGNITNENLQELLSEIISSDIPVNNNTDSCANNNDHLTDSVMFFYGPDATNSVKDVDSLRKIVGDFTTERSHGASTFLHATYVSREQPTFVYRCDLKPVTEKAVSSIPAWVSVPHLYDLIYVWGVPYWQEFDGNIKWELRDKRVSEIIMTFWTSFAKSSDPTNGSLYAIRWLPFTQDNPQLMILDGSFNMSDNKVLNYKAFEFWNNYYPKVLQIATQCCNATDGSSHIQASYNVPIFSQVFLLLLHGLNCAFLM